MYIFLKKGMIKRERKLIQSFTYCNKNYGKFQKMYRYKFEKERTSHFDRLTVLAL